MASELQDVIPKLERGEKLSQPAVDEIKRLLRVLQNEGWSGFIPADEAAKALAERDDDYSDHGAVVAREIAERDK